MRRLASQRKPPARSMCEENMECVIDALRYQDHAKIIGGRQFGEQLCTLANAVLWFCGVWSLVMSLTPGAPCLEHFIFAKLLVYQGW